MRFLLSTLDSHRDLRLSTLPFFFFFSLLSLSLSLTHTHTHTLSFSLILSHSLSLSHTHTQSRYYPGSNDSSDSRGGTPRSRLISPFATYDGTISGGSGGRTISGGSGGLDSPPNTMSGSSDSGGWLFAPSPTKNVDSN